MCPFSLLQAGLTTKDSPDRLLIALEPEAASIYCRKLRLRDCAWAEEAKRRSTVSSQMDALVGDEFQGTYFNKKQMTTHPLSEERLK